MKELNDEADAANAVHTIASIRVSNDQTLPS